MDGCGPYDTPPLPHPPVVQLVVVHSLEEEGGASIGAADVVAHVVVGGVVGGGATQVVEGAQVVEGQLGPGWPLNSKMLKLRWNWIGFKFGYPGAGIIGVQSSYRPGLDDAAGNGGGTKHSSGLQ